MNKIIFVFFIFIFHFSFSQNLVPNPSFEQYSNCPHADCGISLATGWYSAGYTPDYLNACDSPNGPFEYGTPNNFAGYQHPATGNAYVFVGTFGGGREYIAAQLLSPLQSGVKYFVNFKASRIDRFAYCANNKLGALFSTVSYTLGNDSCNSIAGLLPYNFAHVYSNQIITDTADWTTISGFFIADSAYQYIFIGNHFDNNNTDTMCFGSSVAGGGYYIDDIYVSTDSTLGTTKINADHLIAVYPTITDDIVVIQINIPAKASIKIYDTFGRLITTQILLPLSRNRISLSEYNSGIYIVSVNINSKIITKKIILTN